MCKNPELVFGLNDGEVFLVLFLFFVFLGIALMLYINKDLDKKKRV